jgi:hypothetical protein
MSNTPKKEVDKSNNFMIWCLEFDIIEDQRPAYPIEFFQFYDLGLRSGLFDLDKLAAKLEQWLKDNSAYDEDTEGVMSYIYGLNQNHAVALSNYEEDLCFDCEDVGE